MLYEAASAAADPALYPVVVGPDRFKERESYIYSDVWYLQYFGIVYISYNNT